MADEKDTRTAGQKIAEEVAALLKARNALLWVVTPEEKRVERALLDAARASKYDVRKWDCVGGVVDGSGAPVGPGKNGADVEVMLGAIRDSKERAVWILRDLPAWLKVPTVLRAVRTLAKDLPSVENKIARAMIILTPSSDVPPELSDHAIVVKWQLPDRAEIGEIFDEMVKGVDGLVVPTETREAAIEAAVGLSAEAASSCYAKSLVTQKRQIVPSIIAAEKKRVINKEKGIEWFDPDPRGLDAVGGLDYLKPWLMTRRAAFSERARIFGLPLPKGVLMVGVPGCGKSLVAKAVSTAWGVPLLRFDAGGQKSKWVGESEANVRAAYAVAEAVGNCILWFDEIEKTFASATSGAADGGVSSDALGVFLTWMQEKRAPVFVVATSNDVSKLPPELLRKGRFDEMFFVDLPTVTERREILSVTIKKFARDPSTVDVARVADACKDFAGAEVASIVESSLYIAFADGERAITTEDLIASAASVVPLARTAAEKIEALRKWAETRARPASRKEEERSSASGGGRVLDM